MKPIEDDDINSMLSGMKRNVPDTENATAFDQILKRIDAPMQSVKYLQLRNAGIAMLLVIALNVVIVAAAGREAVAETEQQQQSASYLQPYNLNLY